MDIMQIEDNMDLLNLCSISSEEIRLIDIDDLLNEIKRNLSLCFRWTKEDTDKYLEICKRIDEIAEKYRKDKCKLKIIKYVKNRVKSHTKKFSNLHYLKYCKHCEIIK